MTRAGWVLLSAVVLMLAGVSVPASADPAFRDDFTSPAPLGSFSDCAHAVDSPTAYCDRLAGWYRQQWWAYPAGWPDTATQRGLPVGGFYDPDRTIWVSDGQLHLRLFRDGTGPVHSAALVPRVAIGRRFGTVTERFRVSQPARGYKSAHLLWPLGSCPGCEIDFPEGSWDGGIYAYLHPAGGGPQQAFDTGAGWTSWHTSQIQWTPGRVRFLLDGRQVGQSDRGVPDQPMLWVLQNESALDGNQALPGSAAQIDIDWVQVQ